MGEKLQYGTCLLMAVACMMVAGCSGKTVTALSGMQAAEVDAVFKKAEICISSGEVDRAVMILDRGLVRCAEAEQTERAYSMIMRVLIGAGRYDEAQHRYLALAERNRAMAWRLLDEVKAGLKGSRRYEEIVNIVRKLAESEKSDLKLVRLIAVQMEALRAGGRFYAVLDLIPECIEKLPYDESHEVMAGLFASLVREGQDQDLKRLIDFIEARFGDNEGLKELCVVAGIERLLETCALEEAEEAVRENAAALSDINLAAVTGRILSEAERLRKTDLVDRLCSFIVKHAAGKRRTVSTAVVPWVGVSSAKRDWPAAAQRISTSMDLKACPLSVYNAFVNVCHDMIGADDRQSLRKLLEAGFGVLGQLDDSAASSTLRKLLLDCSFVVEEYDVALRLMAEVSADVSPEEAEAINDKLLAHKALKDGNGRLAVVRFRSFMDKVKEWEDDPFDPIAGETVPKETVLGLNAARIADILALSGAKKAAAEARAEAKEYYRIALTKLEEESERYAEIKKELKRLR